MKKYLERDIHVYIDKYYMTKNYLNNELPRLTKTTVLDRLNFLLILSKSQF